MGNEKPALEDVLKDCPFRGGVFYNPITKQILKLDTMGNFRGGQLVLPTDVSGIRAQVILEEVLGYARPRYTLRNICRIVSATQLKFRVDKATVITAHEKVPPLEEPEIKASLFTPIEFSLWKNAVLIVISDEARMTAAHDIMALQVQDAGKALAASENGQIKTIAEAAEETSGGADWGTSTNNPYDNIGAAMDDISPFPTDFMAAHPRVWLDFFSNNYVKGQALGVQAPQQLMGGVFTIPGLPGVTGISDIALTSTIALVGSTQAPGMMFGDGPVESARFRNELAGYDAFIVRHWMQPQVVISQGIRKLTGVHA